MIRASEFRRVLGHFPTGVTVVTSRHPDGGVTGVTISAFCSLSLTPPLILVCLETTADTYTRIREGGVFAVNILEAEGGEALSRRFAETEPPGRFDGVAYRSERTGSPILDDALAWVDCRLVRRVEGGDHTIFIGEVLAADAREGHPLVYYRGGYGRFDA
jgi:flavin reductase (DIM6/NTAB) family NADH-FMN oxidoreductase RutF